MPKHNENIFSASNSNKFNIINIILLDNKYLKECIDILKDEDIDKREKMKYARSFLDTLKKHSEAEKKAIYASLSGMETVRFSILVGEIEYAIIDAKVKSLIPKLDSIKSLTQELEAELKVLAQLVEHHLKEEERKMIPKFKKELDREILNEIGIQFMKIRGFTTKDLQDYPDLQEEVNQWKKPSHRVSGHFLNKVHQYLANLAH